MMTKLDLMIDDTDEILDPHDWSFPVPIKYGPGRLAEVGSQCLLLDIQNPLIVTDRGSWEGRFRGLRCFINIFYKSS